MHMHPIRAHDPAVLRALLLSLPLLAVACRGELGDRCEDASDCGAGLECLHSQVLGHGDDVGAGGSRCGTRCTKDEDCESGGVCRGGGVCVPECRSSSDCAEGSACLEEACALTCEQNSDCLQATCPTPGSFCVQ